MENQKNLSNFLTCDEASSIHILDSSKFDPQEYIDSKNFLTETNSFREASNEKIKNKLFSSTRADVNIQSDE